MLHISNLRYKRNNFILDIPSLHIKDGEHVALIGHNGSGKTTLMECLLGLLPFEGHITLLGERVEKGIRSILPRVSYSMQNPDDQLFCSTIKEDILFASQNFKLKELPQAILKRVTSQVNVDPFLERPPYELSFGEKKNCALAVALATDPSFLILDEPFAMLDNRQKERTLQTLCTLSDKAILTSGHEWDFLSRLTKRMVVLKEGKLVFDGDIKHLSDDEYLMGWGL